MNLLKDYSNFATHHLRFDLSRFSNQAHPPWYINLFHADLIGTLLLEELDKCFLEGGNTSNSLTPDEMTVAHIPHVILEQPHCDRDIEPIIDLSASAIATKSFAGIGSFESVPTNESWAIQEDRPGRFGWIVENGNRNISLKFYPKRPVEVPSQRRIIIFIRYLRTYQNAGMADVLVGSISHPQNLLVAWWDMHLSITRSMHFVTLEKVDDWTQPFITLRFSPGGKGTEKIKIVSVKVCYLPEGET